MGDDGGKNEYGKDIRGSQTGERKKGEHAYLLLVVSEEACLELSHGGEYTQDLPTKTYVTIQRALWSLRTTKSSSSKLHCTGKQKLQSNTGIPLSFLGPPNQEETTRLPFYGSPAHRHQLPIPRF